MNSALPKQPLPDITSEASAAENPTLQWVGMTRLPLHFQLSDSQSGTQQCQGYGQIGVDLIDTSAKGIHMSRLYLGLEAFCREQSMSPESLQQLLSTLLETHEGLSESISVGLDFELMTSRPALESGRQGFKAYPVRLHVWQGNDSKGIAIELTIPYSSTCPCSTALAKSHLKDALSGHFDTDTLSKAELLEWIDQAGEDFPTPHSQRSYARIRLQPNNANASAFDLLDTIDTVEGCLQTAVQTAVKREDELAFAKRNGANLMFCEDAARRLKKLFDADTSLEDFCLEVDHQESLHAHNAVARTSKHSGHSKLQFWTFS